MKVFMKSLGKTDIGARKNQPVDIFVVIRIRISDRFPQLRDKESLGIK